MAAKEGAQAAEEGAQGGSAGKEHRQPRSLCPPAGSRARLHLLQHPASQGNKGTEQFPLFPTTFFRAALPARCCCPGTRSLRWQLCRCCWGRGTRAQVRVVVVLLLNRSKVLTRSRSCSLCGSGQADVAVAAFNFFGVMIMMVRRKAREQE